MNIPSFINKGQPKADWPAWLLNHTKGRPELNGSFLIKTRLGTARVHKGAIVFEFKGVAHVCDDPAQARTLIAELKSVEQVVPATKQYETKHCYTDVADLSDDTDDISIRIKTGTTRNDPLPITRVMPQPVQKPSIARPNVNKPPAGKRQYAKPKGMPPSIEMRHPSELLIDDSYQRSIDTVPSRSLINRIATAWDWRMCLPLVVSKRDQGLFVIDGQHRLAASKQRRDIQYLPCCVFVFENVAEEAAMFVAMNRARRAINRLDDFHAAQASGNEDALAIKGLIESAGFTVSRKTASGAWLPGEVAFTSAIAKARRRYGEVIARNALQIMAAAFKGERLVVGSPVFTAICGMLADPDLQPDHSQLLAAVKTLDMAGWASLIAECKGGTDRNKHIREFLLAAFSDAGVAA